jgi:hypothetical protein
MSGSGIADFQWVVVQEIDNPIFPDTEVQDNINQFNRAVLFSNIITALLVVIPVLGTLTATILGTIVVTSGANPSLTLSSTIITAFVCASTTILSPLNKIGITEIRILAPGVKEYLQAFIAGIPVPTTQTTYGSI